jgi:hypothetical protein
MVGVLYPMYIGGDGGGVAIVYMLEGSEEGGIEVGVRSVLGVVVLGETLGEALRDLCANGESGLEVNMARLGW